MYGSSTVTLRTPASAKPPSLKCNAVAEFLAQHGHRAAALNAFDAATRSYASALELWPAADPERPRLLLSYGTMLAIGQESGEEELELAASAGAV